jgi:hypothetical protein
MYHLVCCIVSMRQTVETAHWYFTQRLKKKANNPSGQWRSDEIVAQFHRWPQCSVLRGSETKSVPRADVGGSAPNVLHVNYNYMVVLLRYPHKGHRSSKSDPRTNCQSPLLLLDGIINTTHTESHPLKTVSPTNPSRQMTTQGRSAASPCNPAKECGHSFLMTITP